MASQLIHLLNRLRLSYPKGVIHVGANVGQEIDEYKVLNPDICLYIEPIPTVFAELAMKIHGIPNHYPIQALCSDLDHEEVTFNISSNHGQSSSFFALGRHQELYPQITYIDSLKLETIRLDTLVEKAFPNEQFQLLVMDTQGSELKVLQGSHKLLRDQVTYVYTEISEDPIYEGSCKLDEITTFLKFYGFRLRSLVYNHMNWGNALYVKNATISVPEIPSPTGFNLALNKLAQQSSLSKYSRINDAQGAVNGKKTGSYSFHTEKEQNPWWQVDLGSECTLEEIRIYNRLDAGYDRARTLHLLISQDGVNWTIVYKNPNDHLFGGIDGHPLIIKLASEIAQYVRIQLDEENYLHLDEVEVYGNLVDFLQQGFC